MSRRCAPLPTAHELAPIVAHFIRQMAAQNASLPSLDEGGIAIHPARFSVREVVLLAGVTLALFTSVFFAVVAFSL